MPSKVAGDYSQYPEPLRELFPYLCGEACDLRTSWSVYTRLFMSTPERTQVLGEQLGGLLGVFQNQLQDEMFIGIGRLFDRDRAGQKNLTFWTLVDCCRRWNPDFAKELHAAVTRLEASIRDIRVHRHKRLAHYDLSVSLEQAVLLAVTLGQLRTAIEGIERLVNLVAKRACNTTIVFDVLDHRDVTTKAEVCVAKARAFDALIDQGVIERKELRGYVV